MRTVRALFWLVTTAFSVSAVGYVLMALDGYDYWSPFFPEPGSLAHTGLGLADWGQISAVLLMIAAWIGISAWAVKVRSRIPTTWRHSNAGVWLWWLVPVASFWKPRDVYLELARAARPGIPEQAKQLTDRWWIWFVVFLLANYLGLLEFGPPFLAVTAVTVALATAMAAFYGGRYLKTASSPQVTYETAPNLGSETGQLLPVTPGAPGWYNDPAGLARHQAYWDGGQWTGATRPDPRLFPSDPARVDKDPLRTVLIVVGIVATVALIGYLAVIEFETALDAIPA